MSTIRNPEKLKELKKIEQNLLKNIRELATLRRQAYGGEIIDCQVETPQGLKNLYQLFTKDRMIVIHNMGIHCKFCTAYADGINAISKEFQNCDIVLLSTTELPELLKFQEKRKWSFHCYRIVDNIFSQAVGLFRKDIGVMPGIISLYLTNEKKIIVESISDFEPGDYFSPIWPIKSLFDDHWEEYSPTNLL